MKSSSYERIAASVRKNLRHGIGLDAELGYDWLGNLVTNSDLECLVDPATGGCLPFFLSIGGPSAVVGLSFDAASVVELRVNAGMAAYSVETSPNDSHNASAVNYRGDRLSVMTWHLGLRFRRRQ